MRRSRGQGFGTRASHERHRPGDGAVGVPQPPAPPGAHALALTIALTLSLALAAALLGGCSAEQGRDGGRAREPRPDPTAKAPAGWGARATWLLPSESGIDTSTFSAEVDNAYWPLAPGTRWSYRAATEEGTETIDVAVLEERREVIGVECAVVRDTVRLGDELIEDTRDWYAQDASGNVWYMGEEVDNYENGELKDHEGSWEAGVDGALPGIKMWAQPRLGESPYYQEYFRGNAEDLARDLFDDGGAITPYDGFEELLVIEEWTPLDPDIVERKYYARDVGTVREEMVRGGDEVVELIEFKGQ